MINPFFIIIFCLILFLIIQTIIIIRYKRINNYEKALVASVSHDLKNPANAQINMLNLLLKGKFGELNPKQYEMIQLTCSSSKYMSNLVGTIITNYKYDTRNTSLNKIFFDIVKLINRLIYENDYILNDKNLKMDFRTNKEECFVYADEIQIERVLTNLLSNAITYSKKETIISINVVQYNKFTDISITNSGSPIPQSELKTIFNKFSKTRNSTQNKYSTGLGLYTSKRIIENHNGKIYVRSTKEGKTTFGFKLKTTILPVINKKQTV